MRCEEVDMGVAGAKFWGGGGGLQGYLGTSICVSADEDKINAGAVWCTVIGA